MRGLAGLAALLVQVPALAAAAPARPAPPPPLIHEQARFRLVLPGSWRRVEQGDCVRDPSISADWCYGLARFEDDRGAYFQVLVDYPPTEVSANAYWELGPGPDGTSLVILRQGRMRPCPLTLEGEAACDRRAGFSVAAWIELGGHHYLFAFGHAKRRKGVDLGIFREILLSFRARPEPVTR